MEKKDKKPPADKPRGESKAEKEAERLERERLRKINRVPDYEALFREQGTSRKGNGFLKRVFRKDWGRLIGSSILYIIKASPIWIMPLVTGDVIDLITERPDGFLVRILIDAVIFAVMVIQNIPTNMWYSGITNRMIRNTTAGIKSSVIRKLQGLSITYHREMEGGKIQSKFLRDIDSIDMYYRNVVQVVIPNLIGAVISVGISLQKSPLVTLFFVAIVPLNVLNAMLYRKKMRRFNSRFRVENEKMSAKLTMMLQMLSLTKAHGLETAETVAMRRSIDSVTQAGLRLDKTNASFGALTWVISTLLSGICFFFCVFLALRDYISTGEVVLFQSLFSSINGSVLTLINVYPSLMTGKEAIDSLSEIMRAEDMENEGGTRIPPDIEGRVDFENVAIAIRTGKRTSSKILRCTRMRGNVSPLSDRPVRERAQSSISSSDCWNRPREISLSTVCRLPRCPFKVTVTLFRWCRKTAFCFRARFGKTSPTGWILTAKRNSIGRWRTLISPNFFPLCRTGWIRRWGNTAINFPADRSSASASHGRLSASLGFSLWTRRPALSITSRNITYRRPSAG